MQVRQVDMTPELALRLLERNAENRVLTPYRVTALAAAMREGRFIPEAAGPVVIGEDKSLQNGQHRLYATIEAEHAWPCILIENAPNTARLVSDTGKKRSFAEVLHYNSVSQGSTVAAVVRLLYMYEQGLLATRATWMKGRSQLSPGHDQMWDFYKRNEDWIQSSIQIGRYANRALIRSVACTGAAVLMNVDDGDASDFFKQLALQGDVTEQVTQLVRSLDNLPNAGVGAGRGDQQHQLALLFKTWNLWRAGDVAQLLFWRSGGKAPEAFPVPRLPS